MGDETQAETIQAGDIDAEDMMVMFRKHHERGNPDKAWQLRDLHESGQPIPYELMDEQGIKSEKSVAGKLEMPPRSGKGSGHKHWAKFAGMVSDLAPEVLEKMTRDEIVEILETREIIPGVDEADEGADEVGDKMGDDEDSVPDPSTDNEEE